MPFISLLTLTPLLAILLPLLHHLHSLHSNYQSAKLTGLPVLLSPLDPHGSLWQLASHLFAPLLHHFEWCRILSTTWTWQDNAQHHLKYGPTFIVASPARNIVFTCDELAVADVLKKWRSWVKPSMYQSMDFYGRNVDTVNGEDWTRHRKITAPCFNERVSSIVWGEARRQTRCMLEHWVTQPGGEVSSLVDDTRVVALHVLCEAGFGARHEFHEGVRMPGEGHGMSYREALMVILGNFVTVMMVAPWESFLSKISPLCTARIKKCLVALREFRAYTEEAISVERRLLTRGVEVETGDAPNLMRSLVRTSEEARGRGIQSVGELSDEEIRGNVFIFNLAGHDTTANTLAYAFLLLALHPEVQAWVGEEVDEVMGGEEGGYEETHPRLKRVLAVMFETLRLYGPAPQIPRCTPLPSHLPITNPSPTSSSPLLIPLPPSTSLTLNIHALHTSPSNYPSPLEWRPSRWIDSPTGRLSDEELVQKEGIFAAWAGGPRICPGMKFSQVEFTGVVGGVLRGGRVVPIGGEGGMAGARREIEGVLRDSGIGGGTLKMRGGEGVRVKVVRRERGGGGGE